MHSELLNLSLFVGAIAKVLLMTGVGVGGAIALLAECCGFRVVALGIEKVLGEAVRARILIPADLNSDRPTSLSRKVRRYA